MPPKHRNTLDGRSKAKRSLKRAVSKRGGGGAAAGESVFQHMLKKQMKNLGIVGETLAERHQRGVGFKSKVDGIVKKRKRKVNNLLRSGVRFLSKVPSAMPDMDKLFADDDDDADALDPKGDSKGKGKGRRQTSIVDLLDGETRRKRRKTNSHKTVTLRGFESGERQKQARGLMLLAEREDKDRAELKALISAQKDFRMKNDPVLAQMVGYHRKKEERQREEAEAIAAAQALKSTLSGAVVVDVDNTSGSCDGTESTLDGTMSTPTPADRRRAQKRARKQAKIDLLMGLRDRKRSVIDSLLNDDAVQLMYSACGVKKDRPLLTHVQREALIRVLSQDRVIIGTSCGTGKTVVFLIAISLWHRMGLPVDDGTGGGGGVTTEDFRPVMLVMPKKLRQQWIDEATDWFLDPLPLLVFYGVESNNIYPSWASNLSHGGRAVKNARLTDTMIAKHWVVITHYEALTSIYRRLLRDKIADVQDGWKKQCARMRKKYGPAKNDKYRVWLHGQRQASRANATRLMDGAYYHAPRETLVLGSGFCSKIMAFKYGAIVVDEVHNICSSMTQKAQVLIAMRSSLRYGMSATSQRNGNHDLWGLLKYMRDPACKDMTYDQWKALCKDAEEGEVHYQRVVKTVKKDLNVSETEKLRGEERRIANEMVQVQLADLLVGNRFLKARETLNQLIDRYLLKSNLNEAAELVLSEAVKHQLRTRYPGWTLRSWPTPLKTGVWEAVRYVTMNPHASALYEEIYASGRAEDEKAQRLRRARQAEREFGIMRAMTVKGSSDGEIRRSFLAMMAFLRMTTTYPGGVSFGKLHSQYPLLYAEAILEEPAKFRAVCTRLSQELVLGDRCVIVSCFVKEMQALAVYMKHWDGENPDRAWPRTVKELGLEQVARMYRDMAGPVAKHKPHATLLEAGGDDDDGSSSLELSEDLGPSSHGASAAVVDLLEEEDGDDGEATEVMPRHVPSLVELASRVLVQDIRTHWRSKAMAPVREQLAWMQGGFPKPGDPDYDKLRTHSVALPDFVFDRVRRGRHRFLFPRAVRNDGETVNEAVKEVLKDTRNNVLLMTIKKGGEGTDGLQHRFNHMHFLSPTMSGAEQEQVDGRESRPGQKKDVFYTFWLAETRYANPFAPPGAKHRDQHATVDSRIYKLVQRKRALYELSTVQQRAMLGFSTAK